MTNEIERDMMEWMTLTQKERDDLEAKKRCLEQRAVHLADSYLLHFEATGCECQRGDLKIAMAEWRKAIKP